ncbi:MAG: deoxyuridine 5'-triphosphate nucleotidohydrolase [Candidatus Heimdallarchaeota archaeon]|nr:deoxyuridine 5'-triphosphate nucleotidohydrolase [Candidatus Heimdallarchaeota archaeon]
MAMLPPFKDNIIKEYLDADTQTQIAGFDLTAKDIMILEDGGIIDFDNSERFIPEHKILEPQNKKWILEPGGYLVRYNEIVEVPLNAIGIVLPRSSLMRIGAMLCSAVWDPGYKGRGIGLLIVNAKITVFEGARIAQIVFIKTQEKLDEGYSGTYQNEK